MNIANVDATDLLIGVWEQTLIDARGHNWQDADLRREFQERLKSIVDDESDDARQNSVQSRGRNLLGNAYPDSSLLSNLFFRQRTETDIAPYGYLQRDLQMRRMWPLKGNSIIQAATSIQVQKVQNNEYAIEGPSRTVKQAQGIIKDADLGNGWDTFVSKWTQDFLTQDNGAFIEVIWDDGSEDDYILEEPAAGAKIVGIAHLDAFRCRRTGDPEHPIVYQSLTGQLHRMHRTRVIATSDMPNPNERLFGRGFCAMSRTLAIAEAVIRYEAYRSELLDDVPPLGLLVLQNINKAVWDLQEKGFQSERLANEQFFFSNILKLFNADPTKPADAKIVPFKNLWENFSEKDFYDVAIDLTAMGFGMDRQELAPLVTAAMGSGMQSGVLAAKSEGKGIATVLTHLERIINQVLPPSCTLHFDAHNDDQDEKRATVRDSKAKTIIELYNTSTKPASSMQGAIGAAPPPGASPQAAQQETDDDRLISKDEARRLLAREIPEWADIIVSADPNAEVSYDDTDDEPLNPTDVGESAPLAASPATAKMIARYGRPCKLYKSGKMVVKGGSEPAITRAEREKARQYVKSIVYKDEGDDVSPSLSTPGQRAYYFGVVQGGGSSGGGSDKIPPMPTQTRDEYRDNHPDVKAAQAELDKANARVAKHQQALTDYALSKSPEAARWNEIGGKNISQRSASEQAEYETLSAHVSKLEGNLKRAKADQSKAGHKLYSARLGAGQEYDKKYQGWAQFTGDKPTGKPKVPAERPAGETGGKREEQPKVVTRQEALNNVVSNHGERQSFIDNTGNEYKINRYQQGDKDRVYLARVTNARRIGDKRDIGYFDMKAGGKFSANRYNESGKLLDAGSVVVQGLLKEGIDVGNQIAAHHNGGAELRGLRGGRGGHGEHPPTREQLVNE